jgi:hypothetical protein
MTARSCCFIVVEHCSFAAAGSVGFFDPLTHIFMQVVSGLD